MSTDLEKLIEYLKTCYLTPEVKLDIEKILNRPIFNTHLKLIKFKKEENESDNS